MMTCRKLILFGCAVFLAVAASATSRRAPDIVVRPVPFASAGPVNDWHFSQWSYGYCYLFYDVANSSTTQSHSVQLVCGRVFHSATVTLKPGEQQRIVLPLLPVALKQHEEVTVYVNGRAWQNFMEYVPSNPMFSLGPRVLLSPAISETSVRYRIGKSKVENNGIDFFAAQMPLFEWPDEWLAYSRFSALLVTQAEYEALSESVARALERFVLAGGSLIIAGSAGEEETRGFGNILRLSSAIVEAWSDEDVRTLMTKTKAEVFPHATGAFFHKNMLHLPRISGFTLLVVYVLLLLITIFLGPVLLFALARRNAHIKVYWIAPMAATATGFGVLVAALCIDGLKPLVRTEELVLLDAQSNSAVTLAYTGIKASFSRANLTFPRDTEVTPISHTVLPGSRVDFFPDAQRFNTAWMPTRIPTYFALRHVGDAPKKTLEILAESEESLTIKNNFDTPLNWLFARGSGEDLFFRMASILPGEIAVLEPVPNRSILASVVLRVWEAPLNVVTASDPSNLPPRTFVATLSDTPFIKPFIQNQSKSRGGTIVYGTFPGEAQP